MFEITRVNMNMLMLQVCFLILFSGPDDHNDPLKSNLMKQLESRFCFITYQIIQLNLTRTVLVMVLFLHTSFGSVRVNTL